MSICSNCLHSKICRKKSKVEKVEALIQGASLNIKEEGDDLIIDNSFKFHRQYDTNPLLKELGVKTFTSCVDKLTREEER